MLVININKFNERTLSLLVDRIGQNKDSITLEGDLYTGRRYCDNERIARMICGYIVEETYDQNRTINYEAANSKLVSMDTHQIDPYIEKAVIESASCDFYYMFEKDWG